LKRIKIISVILILLLAVFQSVFITVAAEEEKELSVSLVEVDRRETDNTLSITYDIVPNEEGTDMYSSRYISWGTAVLTGEKLNSYTMDFDITVTIFNSTISSCYVEIWNGDSYTTLVSHPAGISNKTKLGCQHVYTYGGEYEAYVSEVTVFPVVGSTIKQIGILSKMYFTITQGFLEY